MEEAPSLNRASVGRASNKLPPNTQALSHASDHAPDGASKPVKIGPIKSSLKVAKQQKACKVQGPMPQAIRNEPMEEHEDDDDDGGGGGGGGYKKVWCLFEVDYWVVSTWLT